MKKRITTLGAFAGLMIAGSMLAAPAAGATTQIHTTGAVLSGPALLHAEGEVGSCAVSGGSISWGVKESFRSYISGSIAKGEWIVSDGATYETPNFGWSGASGELHTDDGSGNVSFTGTITFTGHGGILNMVIGNPTIEFAADGTARLLVDARSNDTSGNLVLDELQVELGSLALPAPVTAETGTVTLADVPVTLTEVGVPAFGNFYQAGDALDPITVSFDLDCVTEAAEDDATEDDASGDEVVATPISAEVESGSDFPWLPVGIGAGVVVLGAAAATVVMAARRKNSGS